MDRVNKLGNVPYTRR